MKNTIWLGFNLELLNYSFDYNTFGKNKYCKYINVSLDEFDKFLNNDINISFETIFKIACNLNVSIDSLINNSTISTIIKFK